MKSYALNDIVHEQLSAFASNPNGSLLIVGPKGSGLSSAVAYLVFSIYGQHERAGEVIRPTSGKIDDIRSVLQQISRTRVNQQKPRLIVIDNAHELTHEAQSALLKSIEEPPQKTHFVLATSQPEKLLSTIHSRCRTLTLKRPTKTDLREAFKSVPEQQFEYAYSVADGWPGHMENILSNDNSVIKQSIDSAKEFLGMNANNRAASVIKNQANPEYLTLLIEGLSRICQSAMRAMAKKGNLPQVESWKARVLLLHELEQMLRAGNNPKLVALKLSLSL